MKSSMIKKLNKIYDFRTKGTPGKVMLEQSPVLKDVNMKARKA